MPSTGHELVLDNPVPRMPVLFLWPRSNCNCRCVMCDIWTTSDRSELSLHDIEGWTNDWRELGIKHVVLTGGEPLMYSEIWDLCRILRTAGMAVTLLSTGLTLWRVADRVVEHCDGVRISLDGPPRVHDEIRRVPRAFERLARSVEALKGIRADYPVFARSVVHRRNSHSLLDTVETARETGFDRISLLAADVTSEAFNRPEGWSEERVRDIALDEKDIAAIEHAIAALERRAVDFETGFIYESPGELRRRLVSYYRAVNGQSEYPPNVCNAPWISSVIEYDGTVRPCFFQPPYGNILEAGSLGAVVNSEEAVAFRAELDVATNEICKRCVCTFAVERCGCGWTRNTPFCDNSCVLAEFFAYDDPPAAAKARRQSVSATERPR